MLELGRTHHANAARYVDTVIGADGWTDALGLERRPWMPPSPRRPCTTSPSRYCWTRTAVSPRCCAPVVSSSTATTSRPARHCARTSPATWPPPRRADGRPAHEDWQEWWTAAARDPEPADLLAERAQRHAAHGGAEPGRIRGGPPPELLRRAGFRHVAPVRQFGDSAVLVAVKGD